LSELHLNNNYIGDSGVQALGCSWMAHKGRINIDFRNQYPPAAKSAGGLEFPPDWPESLADKKIREELEAPYTPFETFYARTTLFQYFEKHHLDPEDKLTGDQWCCFVKTFQTGFADGASTAARGLMNLYIEELKEGEHAEEFADEESDSEEQPATEEKE